MSEKSLRSNKPVLGKRASNKRKPCLENQADNPDLSFGDADEPVESPPKRQKVSSVPIVIEIDVDKMSKPHEQAALPKEKNSAVSIMIGDTL